ncbi:MAG: helix-turn-helix domain-containing protein [Ignavibacterium sp.]|nr:helix-turn-helix domain-containing protein [Ignavibacterium sp.]
MPRKILLTDSLPEQTNVRNLRDPYPEKVSESQSTDDLITYSEVLKATILQYPNKMLFSIKESAAALSVSPEFIRKKISDGFIKSVNLGDRKMISINELAKIIYKGV